MNTRYYIGFKMHKKMFKKCHDGVEILKINIKKSRRIYYTT